MSENALADLERELDRCRRTSVTLSVCYVDVVGPKAASSVRRRERRSDSHHRGRARR